MATHKSNIADLTNLTEQGTELMPKRLAIIAVKFAGTYFTLAAVCSITAFNLFPGLYPGDSFMIFWLYVFNIPIGMFLFPLFLQALLTLTTKRKIVNVFLYFIFILIISNVVWLIAGHIFYTWQIIKNLFKNDEKRTMAIAELFYTIISYFITFVIFRNSDIWNPNKAIVEEKLQA